MKKLFIFFLIFVCASLISARSISEFNFRGIRLGMTHAEVFAAITNSDSLKPDQRRYLGKINEAYPFTLKAVSYPFIPALYIEFFENKSYLISILLSPQYFDFFNLTQKLEDKYGSPIIKTSRIVRWSDSSNHIVLNLEYPTTIKIYDETRLLKLQSILSQHAEILTNRSIKRLERQSIIDDL